MLNSPGDSDKPVGLYFSLMCKHSIQLGTMALIHHAPEATSMRDLLKVCCTDAVHTAGFELPECRNGVSAADCLLIIRECRHTASTVREENFE